MTPLRVFFAAFLLVGSLAPVRLQEKAPQPYRVEDPDNPNHYMRPDGKNCATKGDHPCDCKVICAHDDEGQAARIGSGCQWACHEAHCTCHPCPEGECGEHDDHAR
jgi:hypothetical protein